VGWSDLNEDRDVTRRCEHELCDSSNFFTVRGTVIFSNRVSSLELVLEHETFGLVLKCPYQSRPNVYSLLGREVYGNESSEKTDLPVLYYGICTARKVTIFDNYSHLFLN